MRWDLGSIAKNLSGWFEGKGPHKLIPSDTIWGCSLLGAGMCLLEEVYHLRWALGFQN